MLVEQIDKTETGTWLPREASVTGFRDADIVHTVTRMRATDIRVNTRHAPEQFVLSFPPGTRLFDGIRRIGYTVGDKQQLIDERLAERAQKDAVFDRILGQAPPPLVGQRWLVGKPMKLSELKGRPVMLHFWNIGCGPCVHEIPQLQRAYGTPDEHGPVFISIHSDGGAEMIPEIERFLKEHGVTFPVLLDAADPDGPSWGLTNKAYGIYAVPTDAQIDAQGRLTVIGDRRFGE